LAFLAFGLAGARMLLPARSLAAAGTLPEVSYLEASDVTQTGATLEVSIDPEGAATSWELWLECQSNPPGMEPCEALTAGRQRAQGMIAAGAEAQTVASPVTGLQPGYGYRYTVIASNSAGREGFVGGEFETCPSEGLCVGQPWLPGESLWVVEAARRSAEETPAGQAERVATQRELEEHPVTDAAERAARERERYEAGLRTGREAAERDSAGSRSPRCVVPRLRGDSVAGARRKLARAHCALGRVARPRSYHGPLVVRHQSVRVGRRLAEGARVSVLLGPRRD